MSQNIIVMQADELDSLVAQAVRKGVGMAVKDFKAKVYMSEKEAGGYLGISPSTLRQMRSQGRGPEFSKMGGNVRYMVTDLDKYTQKNKVMTHG